MRSKAAKVALCGVVSAFSVVLMLMTGIVPIATIALPALAGCLTIAIVAETNVRYGFAVYCVVSVLAILLTPDREAILFYILFFGYYPTLYGLLMRIKRKPLRVLAKFGVFNLAGAGSTLWMQRTTSRTTFCSRNSTRLFKSWDWKARAGYIYCPKNAKGPTKSAMRY